MSKHKTDKPGSLPQSLEETRYGNLDDTNVLPPLKKSDIPGAFKCAPETTDPEIQVRGLAPSPTAEMVSPLRRSLSSRMSMVMDWTYEKNPHLADRTPELEHMLTNDDIESYIEEILNSPFRPVFERNADKLVTAPAASFPLVPNRSHDTHTGGLLLHMMLIKKISKNLARFVPNMPPLEYTDDQRFAVVFNHDLPKVDFYKRVETQSSYSNLWVFQGIPARGPVDYTIELLGEVARKIFADVSDRGVIRDPARHDPVRYALADEDKKQGYELEETDLIWMKRTADSAARKLSLKMGSWDGIDLRCAGCGERMIPKIPPDYAKLKTMINPNKPEYVCPTHDRTKNNNCTLPMKLKDVQHLEDEQFHTFHERILSYTASL